MPPPTPLGQSPHLNGPVGPSRATRGWRNEGRRPVVGGRRRVLPRRKPPPPAPPHPRPRSSRPGARGLVTVGNGHGPLVGQCLEGGGKAGWVGGGGGGGCEQPAGRPLSRSGGRRGTLFGPASHPTQLGTSVEPPVLRAPYGRLGGRGRVELVGCTMVAAGQVHLACFRPPPL